MSTTYFGKPDAANEKLTRLYPELFEDILCEIKNEKNPEQPYIIAGIRGSGKTALRMILQDRIKKNNSIFIVLDKEYILPSCDYQNSPRRYFHLVANWILILIHNELIKSKQFYSDARGKDALKLIGEKVIANLPGLIKATKISGVIEIDFDKIKGGIPVNISKLKISNYFKLFNSIPNFPSIYVLIDDVDTVFENSLEDDKILYASFTAVCDINEKFGKLINVIIFPNLALERKFISKSSEGQKYRHSVKEISWTSKRLIHLLSLRIAQIRNLSHNLSDIELWSKEFTNMSRIQKKMTTMNISGPRDIIELSNIAKKRAGADRIKERDINKVLIKFAENKFDDINRDYSLVYNDIGEIMKSFYMLLSEKRRDFSERSKLISCLKIFRVNRKSENYFTLPKNWEWFWNTSFSDLIKILYQISAIGVQSGNKTIYFKHDPTRDLTQDKYFIPHPLFKFWAESQMQRKENK